MLFAYCTCRSGLTGSLPTTPMRPLAGAPLGSNRMAEHTLTAVRPSSIQLHTSNYAAAFAAESQAELGIPGSSSLVSTKVDSHFVCVKKIWYVGL